MKGYKSETQNKNIAWFLPRPKPDKYKGGMPLYAENRTMHTPRVAIFFKKNGTKK